VGTSEQTDARLPSTSRQPPPAPTIRVSDQERDAVADRLKDAFAEGRLDDAEFDARMRSALTATFGTDLAVLTTDLPVPAAQPTGIVSVPAGRRAPGRLAVALKSSVRRGGRWTVPDRFTSLIYKGSGRLDLRAAELTAPVTTMVVLAYKSNVDVFVAPGVRVELDGFGVSKGWSAEEDLELRLPADAPVVRVRGVAYKATIEVSTRPAGDQPAIGPA
jgi:hypothetical protein